MCIAYIKTTSKLRSNRPSWSWVTCLRTSTSSVGNCSKNNLLEAARAAVHNQRFGRGFMRCKEKTKVNQYNRFLKWPRKWTNLSSSDRVWLNPNRAVQSRHQPKQNGELKPFFCERNDPQCLIIIQVSQKTRKKALSFAAAKGAFMCF